jgi:Flp pilus assembly protein TadD
MPHAVCRLLAAGLILLSGCASPIFPGLSRHLPSSSGTAGERDTAETAPAGQPRTAQNSDRASAEVRTADWTKPAYEQRVSELLAGAAYHQRARKFAEARNAYEQVLRIDPRNMTANYQLAVIADDEGRFADARQYYFTLLGQSPHNPDILASLGWSYLLQGRYDDCETVLRDALQRSPSHQTALYNLGWLYGTRGDHEYALALFRKAGTEAEAQRALAELRQTSPAPQPPAIEASPSIQLGARERSAPPLVSAPTPWNGEPRGAGLRDASRASGIFSEVDAIASSSPAQANRERQADPQSIVITPGAPRPASSGPRSGHASWSTEASALPETGAGTSSPADWQRNVPVTAARSEWPGAVIATRSDSTPESAAMPRAEPKFRQDAWIAAAQLGLGAGQPCPIISDTPQMPGASAAPARASLPPPIPTDVIPAGQVESDRAWNPPVAPAIYSGKPSPIPAR